MLDIHLKELLSKMEHTQRPPVKNSIFIGIQGKEENKKLLDLVAANFPDHHVHIMDKDLFHKNVELYIRKNVEWKEQESILEYTSKKENIQAALSVAFKIKQAVGDDWFGLKDLVDNTAFTYAQASSILDLQYAFGFLAKKKEGGRDLYMSIGGMGERIKYVQSIIQGLQNELQDLGVIYSKMLEEASVTEEKREEGPLNTN